MDKFPAFQHQTDTWIVAQRTGLKLANLTLIIWHKIQITPYYCEVTGTHVIAMAEAIIGNVNHLSKSENLHCS